MKRCNTPFEVFLDVHEGRADAKTAAQIQSHLANGCENCQTQLTWLKQFMPALHHAVTEDEPHVSSEALHAAQRIARERQVIPVHMPLLTRIARLLFDSRQTPSLAGARGGGRATQMLYTTDAHYVDLWLERQPHGNWYLIGVALPREGGASLAPEQAALIGADGVAIPAEIEANEFHLPSIPEGIYQLQLRLGDTEITAPSITIGG